MKSNLFVEYKKSAKHFFENKIHKICDELKIEKHTRPNFRLNCRNKLKFLMKKLIPKEFINQSFVAGGYFTRYLEDDNENGPASILPKLNTHFRNNQDKDIFILLREKYMIKDDEDVNISVIVAFIQHNKHVNNFEDIIDPLSGYRRNLKFSFKKLNINVIFDDVNPCIEKLIQNFDVPWSKLYFDPKDNSINISYQLCKFMFYHSIERTNKTIKNKNIHIERHLLN